MHAKSVRGCRRFEREGEEGRREERRGVEGRGRKRGGGRLEELSSENFGIFKISNMQFQY